MALSFFLDRFEFLDEFMTALEFAGVVDFTIATVDPSFNKRDVVSSPPRGSRGWMLFIRNREAESLALFIFEELRRGWPALAAELD